MRFLYHTCDIKRQTATGEGISKTMQALATGVACLIMPMDLQSSIDNGFEYGQGYDGFFDTTQDIKKGDKVVYNGSNFIVQGVKDFANMPLVSHKQALLQKDDA